MLAGGQEAEGLQVIWTAPSVSVDSEPAQTLPEDRHPHLQAGPHPNPPPLWLAQAEEADVYGPSVAVVTSARRLLGEVSIEWSRPPEEHGVMRRFFPPRTRALRGSSLLLGTTGGDSYHHWMLDVLPRLGLLRQSGRRMEDFDHVLVHFSGQGYQAETLARAGVPREKIRSLSRRIRYRCERLLVPSLSAPLGHASRANVVFLRNLLGVTGTEKSGDKLLVGRESGLSRRALGWERVVAILAPRGFREFFPGRLSVEAQARRFAAASHVVGVHGAALTNLAFCRPGTRVLEILGADYVNPCYRCLSSAADLDYHAVLGQREPEAAFDLNLSDASRDIRIDPGKVERILAETDFLENRGWEAEVPRACTRDG